MIVGISGVIGAGKSTLCEKLLQVLPLISGEPWRLLKEPVEENPYLDRFYKDPKRWAFTMQMFLLLKRFEASSGIQAGVNYIQDRTLQEDRIFASLAHIQGLMSDSEFETYEGYYNVLSCKLQKPDLNIYLQVSLETSISRIQKRSREAERELWETQKGKEYLKALLELYEGNSREQDPRFWKTIEWDSPKDLSKIFDFIMENAQTKKTSRVF
jgi:deoxyadenosine/deoxycytidine kinase